MRLAYAYLRNRCCRNGRSSSLGRRSEDSIGAGEPLPPVSLLVSGLGGTPRTSAHCQKPFGPRVRRWRSGRISCSSASWGIRSKRLIVSELEVDSNGGGTGRLLSEGERSDSHVFEAAAGRPDTESWKRRAHVCDVPNSFRTCSSVLQFISLGSAGRLHTARWGWDAARLGRPRHFVGKADPCLGMELHLR